MRNNSFQSSVKKKSHYMYSSVHYTLPEHISRRIKRWGLQNIKNEDVYEDPDDPSYGREQNPHVTVLYGIHTSSITPIRTLLRGQKSFKIKLGKVSCFTAPEKFDVVKVEVEGEDLHKLHDYIKDNLATTESFPTYKPHITIAYMKKGKGWKYSGDLSFKGMELDVNQLVFSSHGDIKCIIDLD